MKNCLHSITKWILCLLAVFAFNDLSAQAEVRTGFCDYAIDASCGVAISNQTTVGGPNEIWEYPQCNSYTFSGPEKVYKFTTTAAGNIQIDLTIHKNNLDLDLLLLANDCGTPTCLAHSITSNVNGRTEQIAYNNAPAGTYYVLVDSEKDAGAFDLLITCNVTQSCNLEYTATPNHISCGGSKGSIDVNISWGKAPFKIEWDNANNSVWNTYTSSEKNYTINNLPAGTYSVKITDANGCVEMKNNIKISNSGGSLDATFSATDAPCGSNFGWLNIDVANAAPPYWITVSGPKSGSVQGTSNNTVIKDMPPGNYEITVEKDGCSKTGWTTIDSKPSLDWVAEVSDASCGGKGSFWITVKNGSPTYTIEWWHKDGTSDWYQAYDHDFKMDNMKGGEYTIKITDRHGCWKSKKMVMGGGSNLDFDLESNPATCGSKGSVWVTIKNGSPGFAVEWTGPSSGWKNTNSKSFAVDDLIAGNYEFIIVDSKGCKNTKWVTVKNSGGSLDFALESNGASCGGKGSIWVTITNGSPKYTVEWWGPGVSKWATSDNKSFQLTDLPKGDYTVKITDKNGCSNTKTVKINQTGGLDFTLETVGAVCGAKGSIWIDIKNGAAKYGVDVIGPGVNKWFESSSSKIQVSELPAGNYTVEITDKNGCKGTKYITIQDKGGNLDFSVETTDATCSGKGSSWITIHNGSPKYVIELWGPNNATFWAESQSASFKLSELHPGEYTIKITDKNGCSNTKNFWIKGGGSNMGMDLEVNNATCKDDGRIWVTINGGTPSYHLKWDGPTKGEVNMSSSGYQINNLKAGSYSISVSDHYGCWYEKSVTVYGGGSNLTLALESNNATCSQNGYIWANVGNGEGPYQVSWSGASSGSMNVANAGFQISNLPAGNYSVSVYDKHGCGVTKQTSVYGNPNNVDFDLEANNGSCGQYGYAWVTIKSGNGPFHISWTGPTSGEASSGSEGYQISNLSSGVYTVTVKDKDGCSKAKTIQIAGGSLFTVTTQQTNAVCGSNGEIWIDINGGSAPFNVSLAGPMIGNTSTSDYKYHFPNVPPGYYTITIKDASGCIVTKQITISDTGGAITAAIETNNAVCGNGGSAWVTAGGGSTPYTISWTGPVSNSAQTNTTGYQMTNLPAGNYAVRVTDAYGCYIDKSITINNIGNSLTLSLEATSASCGQKGAIWVTIGGGASPYTVAWTGPSSNSLQVTNPSYQITNLNGGTYTVTITDKNGCSTAQSISVGSGVQNYSISVESTNGSCGGKGSAWITMNGGSANYNISWTGPVTGSATTAETGYRLDNLPAGSYTITVKEGSGCEDTKTITIGNDGSNIGVTLEATSAVCSGKGSIWATISGGTAGFSYSWTGPASGSVSTSNTGYKIESLPAGTYTVTVRDSKGCESSSTTTVQSSGSNIGVTLESTSATCNGKGSIWATISGGTAGFSYSWTGPVSGSVSTSNTGYKIESLPAGTYTVTVRDSKGCESSSTTTVQSVGGNLTVSLNTSTAVACEHDGSLAVNIGGGTAPYTISYTGPTTGSLVANSNSQLVNGLQPGDYTFTVSDANGCSGTKKTKVYNNGSDLGVTLSPSSASCGGKGSMTVNISGGVPNYAVTWYGGGTSGTLSTGNSSFLLTDLPVGTYTVEIKDGIGCSKSATASVSNTGSSIGLQLVPKNDVCGMGGSIEVRINGGSAGYQIDWTGPSSGSQTSGTNVYTITGLTTGNYSVNVRDANGCEAKEWVAVNTGGDVNFNLVPSHAECNKAGDIVVNITSGSANYTVIWSGPSSGSQIITSNFYRINNLTGGTYTVTVKDGKGCDNSQSVVVNSSANNLDLTLTNTNTSCGASNGNITATAVNGQGDYTFSWSGPVSGSTTISSNTYTIWDLPAGSYTVSVIDKNGCGLSKTIQVGTAGNSLGLSVVGKEAICGQPSSIQVTISNGVPGFRIDWSGPSSGTYNTNNNSYAISSLAAGTYTVSVTDAAGCTKAQVAIIQSNRNDVSFTYEARDATCNGKGAIWLTISNGNGPYNITWTGPSSGSSTSSDEAVQINDLVAGTYSVTVNDKNGCSIAQTIVVKNVGGAATVNFAHKPGAVTCNNAGDILLTMISGTAPYTASWTGPSSGSRVFSTTDVSIEDLTIGTYAVTVTGAGGCGALTQNIEIEDKRVVLGVNGTVTNGVCGGKGSVYLSWTGDRDPYTISWTGEQVGSFAINAQSYTVTDLKTGSYTFSVTGYDGCSGQYVAHINNGGTSVTADFTYAVSAKTLSFSNQSSAGTYAWNFGDGKSSSEMNPTHTYEKNGTYSICLNVTNDCGTKQKCKSVSINAVTSQGPSAKVVLGDKSGPKGTVIQLPVTVENCTKLGTLSGSIMMGNGAVAKITGLSPSAISPVYNDQNHSFSYLSTGTGMTINSQTILFYINVKLIGGLGQSSTVDLSSLPVALELTCTEDGFASPMTPEVAYGRVSVSSNTLTMTEVGGNVKTFWGDGVGGTMVTIRSDEHEMNPLTSVDGEYTASEVPMGYEYTFTPSKISNPANGLSTYGLFLTQKYILGYQPEEIQTPYQVIAMDANCSGTLTTFDLFAMQQMLVGNLTEFPGCDSWVFVSSDHEFPEAFDNKNVFPYANSHTMMLEEEDAIADFIGVKVGDILGRAVPNDAFANTAATDRDRKVLPLQIDRRTANAGEIFEVSFQTKEVTDLVSFQLGLDYDVATMELVEFVPNSINELSSAMAGVNRNQLKLSWYDPSGKGMVLAEEETLFTLKFVAKQKISDILGQFTINNRTFVSELHTQSADAYRFKLETNSPINSTFKVHQNTPNPFQDATTITIEVPESLDAEIILHDHFGRTIQTIRQSFEQGTNQIQINRANLSSGVYYYTVKAGDFADTKRMLIVE